MTMGWRSAFEQAVTNEEVAIQAGSEGSEYYLDNVEIYLLKREGLGASSNIGRDQGYFHLHPSTEEFGVVINLFQ